MSKKKLTLAQRFALAQSKTLRAKQKLALARLAVIIAEREENILKAEQAVASLPSPSPAIPGETRRQRLDRIDKKVVEAMRFDAAIRAAEIRANNPGVKAWRTKQIKYQTQLVEAWTNWRDETRRPGKDAKPRKASKGTMNAFRMAYADMRRILGLRITEESWYFIGSQLGFHAEKAENVLTRVIGAPDFAKVAFALY